MKSIPDPFKEARKEGPVLKCPVHGEDISMLLKHRDVRAAAKDWETFSSDAPFRVPIPSEEEVRSIRQLPIETDPPEHTEWRAIVQPFFDQPKSIQLDRKPNPHLSFGFGKHLCLGAPHARLIVRSLLKALSDKVAAVEVLEAVPNVEREEAYTREIGYDSLSVKLSARP